MVANRTLKASFWSSKSLPDDPNAKLLFMAMWNWADDFGVGVADPEALCGFTFKKGVTPAQVEDMFRAITYSARVDFYVVAGTPYYSIPTWHLHQEIADPQPSRLPSPDRADHSLYREYYDRLVRPSTEAAKRVGYPPVFEEWWQAYPRKVAKKGAYAAYEKALTEVSADRLLRSTQMYRDDPNRSDKYTLYPATWLNKGCWDDEPSTVLRDDGRGVSGANIFGQLANDGLFDTYPPSTPQKRIESAPEPMWRQQ